MINIIEKNKCCGCEACVQICPKKCISFLQDSEGFSYPHVDTDNCINCGLCEKVCPELNSYDKHIPLEVLSAINKDEDVRSTSSSGGVFTLLAENTIDQGGVVFGVRFDDDWQVVYDYAESKEDIIKFRGSKYLQARVGDSYLQCKRFLEEGRKVLFAGTQCQIAALNHFLRKDYPNLLAVDFICHGVPSPKVWNKYLKEAVKAGKQAISDIKFRDKRKGWKDFSFTLDYNKNSKTYTLTSSFPENPYSKAFLENLILRPSCHTCPAKGGRSCSDITIADFWGIHIVNPEMDDDKGTSLVMIHTQKGRAALQREKLICKEASYEDVKKYNPAVETPAIPHPKRSVFFNNFSDEANLHELIDDCLRPTIKQRIIKYIRYPFHIAKRMLLWKAGGGGNLVFLILNSNLTSMLLN